MIWEIVWGVIVLVTVLLVIEAVQDWKMLGREDEYNDDR